MVCNSSGFFCRRGNADNLFIRWAGEFPLTERKCHPEQSEGSLAVQFCHPELRILARAKLVQGRVALSQPTRQ